MKKNDKSNLLMSNYNFILVFTFKIKHLFCNIFSRFVVQFFFLCVYDIKDSLGLFNYFICVKLSLGLLMSSPVNFYSSSGFLYLVMYNWQSGIRRPASATSDSPRFCNPEATTCHIRLVCILSVCLIVVILPLFSLIQ